MNEIMKKKPKEPKDGFQLYSKDVTKNGAKNFFFALPIDVYNTITKKTSNFYEDHTYCEKIRLHVDIDYVKNFDTNLERDNMAENIIVDVTNKINDKLLQEFKIFNTPIITMLSDTLKKLSVHIIYKDVLFHSMAEMKFFMQNISTVIDMSIYKRGCFRMRGCPKFYKYNPLEDFITYNYDEPSSDFQKFLDSCLCNSNLTNVISYENVVKTKVPVKYINKQELYPAKQFENRIYSYPKYNLDMVRNALEPLTGKLGVYCDWLLISYSIKDLWLGIRNSNDRTLLYNIYEEACMKAPNFNKIDNINIFQNLDPIVDINYLFNMNNMKYFIHPFYDYKQIIFNINHHKNIVIENIHHIRNSKFADKGNFTSDDVNTFLDQLVKYKQIYIKSPTGTGKTDLIKDLLNKINKNNIISITSRVNLAGEHVKFDLNFYKKLCPNTYKKCDKLVIQLESIIKCNYRLFKNGVVILDEINSLLSHLRSPTFNNRRTACYTYLMHIIKNADYIICLDADLSDWNIEFINQIRNNNYTEKLNEPLIESKSEQSNEPSNEPSNKPSNEEYIVYQNICKNKSNVPAEFFKCDNKMIKIMEEHILNGKCFVASFDSLEKMKKVIDYLSKCKNSKSSEWLIYSSEINYDLIDTITWIGKYVFFTPTIIYGVDYNHIKVDVFSFTYKFHLNSLQIYQMISRVRTINKLHIYCHDNLFYLKYKSKQDVIDEYNAFENNLNSLVSGCKTICEVDDAPYKTMYFNFKYMDALLKTNIQAYLTDMMLENGYIISYNEYISEDVLEPKISVKEKIDNLMTLEDITPFERNLLTSSKKMEKHLNLKMFLDNTFEKGIEKSITTNLFSESIKCKQLKLKIISEFMNVLKIDNFEMLNRDITTNFGSEIKSQWLDTNLTTIKKAFDIRAKKYDTINYYNMYLLLTTMLSNMFDDEMFESKYIKIKQTQYQYVIINKPIMEQHLNTDTFIELF